MSHYAAPPADVSQASLAEAILDTVSAEILGAVKYPPKSGSLPYAAAQGLFAAGLWSSAAKSVPATPERRTALEFIRGQYARFIDKASMAPRAQDPAPAEGQLIPLVFQLLAVLVDYERLEDRVLFQGEWNGSVPEISEDDCRAWFEVAARRHNALLEAQKALGSREDWPDA